MYTSLRVQRYRSIVDSGPIPLGKINILVGLNNSGKSAFLRAVYAFQEGSQVTASDIRIGETTATAELAFDGLPLALEHVRTMPTQPYKFPDSVNSIAWTASSYDGQPQASAKAPDGQDYPLIRIPSKEPNNIILPVLAGRRVSYYREQPSRDNSITVYPQDSNLVSRIMPLIGSRTSEGIRFAQLCRDVLHIDLQVLPGENQQSFLGVQVDLQTSISLEAMGAGLAGALNLLVGLCQAKGKLFIIEEPEEDLHPAALKALLDAIIEASKDNQFLISTHSSIVLTKLGAIPDTTVIHVTSDDGLPPTSTYEIKTTSEERTGILRDLGYSLADMSLGEGWLIFEESSAERLVCEWLIPWFAPGLLRLRHVSARGNERVPALLTDFKEMFLFSHLEQMYRYRAWVILDGDQRSLEILEKMKAAFAGWPENRFLHWNEPVIEHYYPDQFKGKYSNETATIRVKRERQQSKENLFRELISWIEEDPGRARGEFETCAAEIIKVLRDIERELAGLG
jgi:predicted ATPase